MKQYQHCLEKYAALDTCEDLSQPMLDYLRDRWRTLYFEATDIKLNEVAILQPLLEQNSETGDHTVHGLIQHVRGVLRNGSLPPFVSGGSDDSSFGSCGDVVSVESSGG
ncbi:MAG: hypothetical protein HQ518_18585 [Rhodopirellula sp.]|nr:hypothetical protein [Rhodopirellula sp.]